MLIFQGRVKTAGSSIVTSYSSVSGLRAVMRSPEDKKPVVEIKAMAPRVILAAGAVNTPLLLQKQNLANSSGMVGRNLHCHPGVGAIAKFREDILIWKGATQGFYGHHPEDPEILLETFSSLASIPARPERAIFSALRLLCSTLNAPTGSRSGS